MWGRVDSFPLPPPHTMKTSGCEMKRCGRGLTCGDCEPIRPSRNKERTPQEIKHIGGGWYILPDGRKIRGKKKALEALNG